MKAQRALTRHYSLACPLCGSEADDDGLVLECAERHGPALLHTQYATEKFSPCTDDEGLFRYRDWLPVVRTYENVGRTVVYRSEKLARFLGLSNLWIAFNGYWPERGAFLETATFKELEAYTVLARLPGQPMVLTVPSSGNTGAAFAWACSRERVPCLIIIPASGLRKFRFREPLHPCVGIAVIDDGDYPDAISFAGEVSHSLPFQPEGGVKNVGRRDGLATVMLSAFEEMQELPACYFQAVGSGTGAIAAHEASKRLARMIADPVLPKLMLCQNKPFAPIYDSWRPGGGAITGGSNDHFRRAIKQILATELTNWAPPYSVRGGVFDVLTESGGDVLCADNDSVRAAMATFGELEGIDIEPAAAVAVACLRQAAADKLIDTRSAVLLNVTGGGRARYGQEHSLIQADVQFHFTRDLLRFVRPAADRVCDFYLSRSGGAAADYACR